VTAVAFNTDTKLHTLFCVYPVGVTEMHSVERIASTRAKQPPVVLRW